MGAADKGVKKARGDYSDSEVEHDRGTVDEEAHGFAPDVGHAGPQSKEAARKEHEAHGTQPGSRADGSVEVDPDVPPKGVGDSINDSGNERALGRSEEERRKDREETGIDPGKLRDETMPNLRAGDQAG